MSNSAKKKTSQVLVWVPANLTDEEHAGLPSFRGIAETVLKPVRVDAEKIANNLRELVESLEPTLSLPARSGGLSLDELELNLKVSASGEVGFVASVSASAEASITMRMRRR